MADTEKFATTGASATVDPDFTGEKLGDYRLLRRLGRGGMGEVYLAQQESLGRQAALKILRPSLATDANYVQRFMHEARAAAKLTHRNIAQIYEVGCVNGIHYIAQEYVPGQNLRQLLSRRGRPLELPQALSIIRQVAQALQKAAEQGIVHRDIKPENILLTPDGEVKVADFGLARVVTDAEAMQLTQIGMTMGSPLYMSPEQAEGRPVDPRSDLYSFGATCYHMLGGRPPFDGETPLAIAVQHVKSEPTPLNELRPDIPPALAAIVHRLLAKRPQDRFLSAAEVLRNLRTLPIEGPAELDAEDQWNTSDPFEVGDARFAATQRLVQIMRTQAIITQRRTTWWIAPALIVAGLLLGVGLASATRPRPLLEVEPVAAQPIPQQSTVTAQLFYAELRNTEDAWNSVAKYFPPGESEQNQRASFKAQKGLADLYLDQGRFEEAAAIYERLTQLDPIEIQLRMQGHAGLAQIYYVTSQDEAAREELVRVWEFRTLLDEKTLVEVEKIARKLGG